MDDREYIPVLEMIRKTHRKDYVTVLEAKRVMTSVLGFPVNSHVAAKIVRDNFSLNLSVADFDRKILTPQIGHNFPPLRSSQVIFGVGWKPEYEAQIQSIMEDSDMMEIPMTDKMKQLATISGRNSTNRKRVNPIKVRAMLPDDCQRLWSAMRDDTEKYPYWSGNPVRKYVGSFPNVDTEGKTEYRLRLMKQANMIQHVGLGTYILVEKEDWNHNLLGSFKSKVQI